MTAQDYLQTKLAELNQPNGLEIPANNDELIETIYRLLMSKKFRKYAASETLQEQAKAAIRINVENGDPINITFLHGAYKLWRLEESPEVDWAELFSLMHYTNWVKHVCEIYKPGVWFDFFVDDLIVPKLDNVPISDIRTYVTTYQELIDFLKAYQPANLFMTIHTVGDQFETEAAFDESLQKNFDALNGELPVLNDAQKAMVEFNTKVTAEQLADPQWREKVYALHNAYGPTKAEPGYHKGRPEKILAFPTSLPLAIAVGTTKDSIMKFWVGAGVLKPKNDSYRQIILSPTQLENCEFTFEPLTLDGLNGKNFTQIRVLH